MTLTACIAPSTCRSSMRRQELGRRCDHAAEITPDTLPLAGWGKLTVSRRCPSVRVCPGSGPARAEPKPSLAHDELQMKALVASGDDRIAAGVVIIDDGHSVLLWRTQQHGPSLQQQLKLQGATASGCPKATGRHCKRLPSSDWRAGY